MVLKVKLIGSGKQGDPLRVALPTYGLLHGNITQGWALVSVPDDVHGLTAEDLKHEKLDQTTEGPHYYNLCGDCTKKITDNLEKKYQEHKGEYSVDIVGAQHAA